MPRKLHHQTIRRLTYFAAIAEAGSIRGAATALGLSVPVVSTALSDLEEELGVTLAVRTTRSFVLTGQGERIYAATQELLVSAESVLSVANPDAERPLEGALALTLPTEMATHWLPPLIAEFRAHHPGVQLHVDSNDRMLDLRNTGFDLAIRAYGPQPPGRGQLPLTCICQPGHAIRTETDEMHLPLPLLTVQQDQHRLPAWQEETGTRINVHFDGTITVGNREAARNMAALGLGAALVLSVAAERDLAAGRLVPVHPGLKFGTVRCELQMRDTLPSPEARAFAELVSRKLG